MAIVTVNKNDVPDGGGAVVPVREGLKLAVFRVGDRIAAIDNRCPHAGGSMGEGPFDGTQVKCPLHGFRVDVWKGKGNGGKPVPTFACELAGEEIRITVPDA